MNQFQLPQTPSLSNLLQGIGLQSYELRLLPDAHRRGLTYSDLSIGERENVHVFLEKVSRALLSQIIPNCVEDVLSAFQRYRLERTDLAITEGLKASKPGSIQRRTMRAIICAINQSHVAPHLVYSVGLWKDTKQKEESPFTCKGSAATDKGDSKICDEKDITHFSEESSAGAGRKDSVDLNNSTSECPAREDIKFRCNVSGCIVDWDLLEGVSGTATGHNCAICMNSVHLICCVRVLGQSAMDSDARLLCSICFRSSSCTVEDDPMRVEGQASSADAHLLGATYLRNQGSMSSGSAKKDLVKRAIPSSGESKNKERKWRTGSFSRLYQQGRKDWDYILVNGFIPVTTRTRKIRSDDAMKIALKFLFPLCNVQLLSWGTKRVRSFDDNWVDFPAVIRKKSTEEIQRRYSAYCTSLSLKPLSRTSFIAVANELTRGQQKRKAAVDYVLGCLCYDNLGTVREIVEGEIQSVEVKQSVKAQIDAVEEFMKFSYLEHVSLDSDALNDQEFAFGTSSSSQPMTSDCKSCMIPYQVIRNVSVSIEPCPDDVRMALQDCQDKLMLFMSHQHRCKNQQDRIAKAFETTERDTAREESLILVDYKMKMEPIRYREKTVECFGKRGMSWHGAVIFYSDGEGGLQTLFLDHILENDTKQDRMAVTSLVGAVLSRMKREIPTVRSFTLLSDNARCYQNDVLPVMLPFISKHHGLSISSFIHSEMQQGKSLIDAHFAPAMMHMNRYVNASRSDVCTPSADVDAINWQGGIANTVAEMVRKDRNHPNLMCWEGAVIQKRITKLGRIN